MSKNEIIVGRVFCDEVGRFGNEVAVIVDQEAALDARARTTIAKKLGFSEIVFVDSIEERRISIFHSSGEIDFAGHAAVGAASFFREYLDIPLDWIKCRASRPRIRYEGDCTFVEGRLVDTPPWKIEHIGSERELRALDGPLDPAQGHSLIWSWIDEDRRVAGARTFAADWDIPEDEANGSGCMLLVACLGGAITIRHGRGSVIEAAHERPGFASIGGRVIWGDHNLSLSKL